MRYLPVFYLTLASLGLAYQQEVSITTTGIHVPSGFDSNDNSEIMITGDLPNTCYRRPQGQARLVGKRIKIDVTATKLSPKNNMCIKAVVPYMISVSLGQLKAGYYPIDINEDSDTQNRSHIKIARASSNSIDDFVYANIQSVNKKPDERVVMLDGQHPSSCMELLSVEVIPNESNNTLSVLPIIKQTQEICDCMVVPFSYKLELPDINQDTVLHVRKIDGTAINYLVK